MKGYQQRIDGNANNQQQRQQGGQQTQDGMNGMGRKLEMQFREVIVAHAVEEGDERTEDVLGRAGSSGGDFNSLLLSAPVLDGLTAAGFKRPSPVQREAIPVGKLGLDMVVQAKSGTGKTAVFSVLALETVNCGSHSPQVLIVAPTREIAFQISECLKAIGAALVRPPNNLKVCLFIGGTNFRTDAAEARGRAQIVVGTPGRLCQLVNQSQLSLANVRLFVLDEADKMMDDAYKPHVNWLFSQLPASKQVCVFSATYPARLDELLTQYMRSPTMVKLDSKNVQLLGIKQYMYVCESSSTVVQASSGSDAIQAVKVASLKALLARVSYTQCLIYTNYLDKAQWLSEELTRAGLQCDYISSAIEQHSRNRVMRNLKAFKTRLLVSTDLTARGIDAQQVNLVVNFEVPSEPETYFHRIGRAGRYGSQGAAITLCVPNVDDRRFYSLGAEGEFLCRRLPDSVTSVPTDLCNNKAFADAAPFIDFELLSRASTHYRKDQPSSNSRAETADASADYEQPRDESGGRCLVNYGDMALFDDVYEDSSIAALKRPAKHTNGKSTTNREISSVPADSGDKSRQSSGSSSSSRSSAESNSVRFYGDPQMAPLWSVADPAHVVYRSPRASTSQPAADADDDEWRPVFRNRPPKYACRVDPGYDGWSQTHKHVAKWLDRVQWNYSTLQRLPSKNSKYDRSTMFQIRDQVTRCFTRQVTTAASPSPSHSNMSIAQKLLSSTHKLQQQRQQQEQSNTSPTFDGSSPTCAENALFEQQQSSSSSKQQYSRSNVLSLQQAAPRVFADRLDPAVYRRMHEADRQANGIHECEWMLRQLNIKQQQLNDEFKGHYTREQVLSVEEQAGSSQLDLSHLQHCAPEIIRSAGQQTDTKPVFGSPWKFAPPDTPTTEASRASPLSWQSSDPYRHQQNEPKPAPNPFTGAYSQRRQQQQQQRRPRGGKGKPVRINARTADGRLAYDRRDFFAIRGQLDLHGWRSLARQQWDTLGVGDPFVEDWRMRCKYSLQVVRRRQQLQLQEQQQAAEADEQAAAVYTRSAAQSVKYPTLTPDIWQRLREDMMQFAQNNSETNSAGDGALTYRVAEPADRCSQQDWAEQCALTKELLAPMTDWLHDVCVTSLLPPAAEAELLPSINEQPAPAAAGTSPPTCARRIIKYNREQMLALWQDTVAAAEPATQQPWYPLVVDQQIFVPRQFSATQQHQQDDQFDYKQQQEEDYEDGYDYDYDDEDDEEEEAWQDVPDAGAPDDLAAYQSQLVTYYNQLSQWHASCASNPAAVAQLSQYIQNMLQFDE